MNCRRTLTACLSLISVLSVSRATADEEADHAALKELVAVYETAIDKSDPDVLKPYLAAEFTGVMVTGEEVASLESLDAYWKKIQSYLGDGGKYTVKVNVPEPAAVIGDLAYASGTTDDLAITSDGKEYPFHGYWTAVCRREGDGWKIVRIHGSMDALTNTFAMTSLQRASTYAGIIGGVVGFLLGALVLWMISRRRSTASPNA